MTKMQPAMPPLDPDEDVIRRNLAKFREELGFSRATLADLSGVPEKNILRYEKGETGVPSSVLAKLAQALGRKPGDFFEAKPPPARPEDAPALFFRQRPGVEVPEDIAEEVREFMDRANQKIRNRKLGKK